MPMQMTIDEEIIAILANTELDEEEKIVALLELNEPSIDEAMAEKIVKGYVRGYKIPKGQKKSPKSA